MVVNVKEEALPGAAQRAARAIATSLEAA